MRRALVALLVVASGCAGVESATRTERGPLLRTFDRPQVLEGGVKADLHAEWPTLGVGVVGYDTCRSQVIEEYAEEQITERKGTAAGPSVSMGLVGTLGGGVLLALTPVFSNTANTSVIDEGGRYGPGVRQYTVGIGIGLVSVGVPALVVGIIQALQSGEDIQTRKVEQVRTQRDARCNDRPIDGPIELVGERGRTAQGVAKGGEAKFSADSLAGEAPEGFKFFGRDVELDASSRAVLDGFFACASLEKEQVASIEALASPALVKRIERARACRTLRPEVVGAHLDALQADLQRRRDGGEKVMGPRPTSWEDAVASWSPRLKFADDSPDLAQLDSDEPLVGAVATVLGVVSEGLTANIGVVRIGAREVFLYLPAEPPWAGEFPAGSRVEAVAVVVGRHTLGERTLPLLRAVWLRAAPAGK